MSNDSNKTSSMPLTGERTVPDIAEENYWFRRHEIAYYFALEFCDNKKVLEAGVGEGYGANLISTKAKSVEAIDYDQSVIDHISKKYPKINAIKGNIVELPYENNSFDVVVNFQVIEHLWDQEKFIDECYRVLNPGGMLLISTPNRITFSPGKLIPTNPFHTKEFSYTELEELVNRKFTINKSLGIFHGKNILDYEKTIKTTLLKYQIDRAINNKSWDKDILKKITELTINDFNISPENLNESLDLLIVGIK